MQEKGVAHIGFKGDVKLNDKAKEALLEADYIVIGPGNYFCSLVPCLVTSGFVDALQKTKAKIIFPINLTNKLGHTMHWTVTEYVAHLEGFLKKDIDYVLINSEFPSEEQVEFYEIEEGDGVLVLDDYEGNNAVRLPLLSHVIIKQDPNDAIASTRSFIRHSRRLLAKAVMDIASS